MNHEYIQINMCMRSFCMVNSQDFGLANSESVYHTHTRRANRRGVMVRKRVNYEWVRASLDASDFWPSLENHYARARILMRILFTPDLKGDSYIKDTLLEMLEKWSVHSINSVNTWLFLLWILLFYTNQV